MKLKLLLPLIVVAAGAVTAAQNSPLLVRGGWRFDTASGGFVANRGILVAGGRILRLDPGVEMLGSEVEVVTLRDGDHVLPGLVDLHAHYNLTLLEKRRDETRVNPVLWLANGVTATFPAGEYNPEDMRRAQQEIDSGRRPGPRILRSGPYFGSVRAGWDSAADRNWIESEVARLAGEGVAGLKAKRIGKTQLEALIGAAHRHGLTVTAHLGSGFRGSVNPEDAIRMGIDRIEHFLGGEALPANRSAYASLEALDPEAEAVGEIIQLYLKSRVYFDATLSAYGYFGTQQEPPFEVWTDEARFLTDYVRNRLRERPERAVNTQFEKIYHVKKQTLRRFYEAGGADLLTLGTDHPSWGQYLAGFVAHREMRALVEAGLPPAAVLKIATINGARALGMDRQLGSIEVGKLADFFVVNANPLDDISNARAVRLVVKGGRLYDAARLLASVEGRLGPVNAEEAGAW